ncbi:cell division protein FtsK [Kribbella sp. NPDC050470]|uniref:cell division protein FtsK n=1 Tax=unclassified Kribbella TaxID=2644121 RepID=UPI0037BDF2C4
MPNEPVRVSRRLALTTAALLPGAVVLAGCDDGPSSSGTPGAAKDSKSGQPAEETPSTDPVVVAALSTAAAQVTQLSLRYATMTRKFPALRTQLAAGAKYHAAHLARLKETAGVQAAAGKAPVVPTSSQAALAELARQEKATATAHAAAAAKLAGSPARLLAMIAAAETQLATTLTPKKKAQR